MIIAVQNQKGGVGKTTISVHISHGLSLQGSRVLLVDADPQGSARDWAAARQGAPLFNVIGLDRPVIHKELPAIAKNYDHIVIDGPPRVSDLARSAIIASDMVLIPVQPSPYDVWAAQEVVTLVKDAQIYKPALKSVFAVNRKIVGTAIGRDVVDALAGYELPVLEAEICQRVAFAESAATGQTVLEVNRRSAASVEILVLVSKLLEVANG